MTGSLPDVFKLIRRTAVDWAEEIKYMVDEMYPEAEKIVLVMDNLNTHKPSSLYKKFKPEKARRIIKKLDINRYFLKIAKI